LPAEPGTPRLVGSAQVYLGSGAPAQDFVVNDLLKLEKAVENRNDPNPRLPTQVPQVETQLSVSPHNISSGLEAG
jgi:hypothetical protein